MGQSHAQAPIPCGCPGYLIFFHDLIAKVVPHPSFFCKLGNHKGLPLHQIGKCYKRWCNDEYTGLVIFFDLGENSP